MGPDVHMVNILNINTHLLLKVLRLLVLVATWVGGAPTLHVHEAQSMPKRDKLRFCTMQNCVTVSF